MRYYIIAGEASGDLHASHLIKSIKRVDATASIHAWGGDRMQSQGATIRKHYRETAFMGFLEVIKNLKQIRANFSFCKKDILSFNPDVVVFIDYPGFNLRMAKWAKKKGIKTAFYISPQIWAWKSGRVKIIRKYVDKMITILPFEKEFYHKHKVQVDYVGHPLLDEIDNFAPEANYKTSLAGEMELLALLPGSRKQEVERMLPRMLQASSQLENHCVAIAKAPSLPFELYEKIIKKHTRLPIQLVENKMYQLLHVADFVWVTSGTATLETALFKVPQIVCYIADPFSYWIAKRLIKVKFISLVNLIMDRKIIPELIQSTCTVENIVHTFKQMKGTYAKNELFENYNVLANILGGPGASQKAAEIIIKLAKS
jgi:lipid-A-disaccharide synthase